MQALPMLVTLALLTPALPAATADLWEKAQEFRGTHRFSTLFTAQDVQQRLGGDEGLRAAVDWCRRTAVTRAFLETFRDGFRAERSVIERAKRVLSESGIDVSGCVTTTQVGKRSTGWKGISCYTDQGAQEKLREIFELTASLFDEIMIDDFWFTDCACGECDAARLARTVSIGDRRYPVAGDTWEDYRCELMVRLSQEYILAAGRRVNPKVKIIVKYPQWYDRFHERGYDVTRETRDFDRIWVGTETRDYGDKRWGGTVQYEAYFIMRWLGGIGGEKCGGGWFDPYGTTERTYVEQARQTVLAGARESLLFCYGSLQGETGPKNVEALRAQIPQLFEVSREVRRRQVIGLAAYKPPSSHPDGEDCVFDFVGMLGIPLVPCHELAVARGAGPPLPEETPAAFLSTHALKDPELTAKLEALLKAGTPILLTDGLSARLEGKVKLGGKAGLDGAADRGRAAVQILKVQGAPKSLLDLPQESLDRIRAPLLEPLKVSFRAPSRVALYLFQDGSWVVENFNDAAVRVQLNGRDMDVEGRGWAMQWK